MRGFFGYEGGVVAVAREPGLWLVEAGGREASHRLLDAALEELLHLGNRELAALTVSILEWELAEQQRQADGDGDGRRLRELASLHRLLTEEEASGRPDSAVARAARDLLAERDGIDPAAATGCGRADDPI